MTPLCYRRSTLQQQPQQQPQQQQHESRLESLRESPRDGGNAGNIEGCDEEKDETDRVARGLMESTALEPAPPPTVVVAEAEMETAAAATTGTATEEEEKRDPLQDPSGVSATNKSSLLDEDSTLGGMISPRPAEHDGEMQEEHASGVVGG